MKLEEKAEIEDAIERCVEAKMSPVMSELKSIQRTVDLIKEDMDHDREDFALMKTSDATIERLARELVDMYSNIARRVAQKSDQKVQEAIVAGAEAVAGLVEPVMQKAADKIKKNEPLLKNKKRWFQFWR